MSRSNSIKSNLADGATGREVVLATREQPDTDKTAAKDSFSRAVTATTKSGKEVAFELGMTEQHLSDFRTGQRVVAFYAVWRLCRKNKNTAAVMAAQELLEGSDYEVVRKRKVNKRVAREQMRLQLERSADVFDLIAEKTARALGASKQDVIDAWNEKTGVEDETK